MLIISKYGIGVIDIGVAKNDFWFDMFWLVGSNPPLSHAPGKVFMAHPRMIAAH